MISFEMENYEIDKHLQELAVTAIEKALDFLDFEYEVEVTLTTTTDSVIREINKEHRNLDKSTDVLSFPMIDWPRPCDYDYLEDNLDYLVNPETECVLLGDIVLSIDRVESQAKEFGHKIEREFSFLIVHSMLHLFGYDHMSEFEEAEMIELQKEIMATIAY